MKEHESVLLFSRGGWTCNKQMQERTGGGADRVKYEFGFRTESPNYNGFKGRNVATLPELRVPSSWQKFNCEVGLHPTQKPVALFEYLIRTNSNPGELVLGHCIGSGTTAIACLNTGRNYIGFENNEGYYEAALKRITTHSKSPLGQNT
jgi:site-specific DNA-methyltransferase (adenine-specific)